MRMRRMIGRCLFALSRYGAQPALFALGLAAVSVCAGPAPAQSVAAPPATLSPAHLPFTVGRVHRDPAGHIVPDTRPTPEVHSYESAPEARVHPARPANPGRTPPPHFEPEDSRIAGLAHQRQLEITRILEEERLAKRRGVRVNAQGLTPREQFLIHELRRTDRDVRAHEFAHYFTGRPFTAEPEYWFVVGPLGKRYAVAGHVPFDFSPIPGDARATIRKFETLRRAALAPGQPSTFDLQIASEFDRLIVELNTRMARQHAAARLGQ
jgi:SprA-related family